MKKFWWFSKGSRELLKALQQGNNIIRLYYREISPPGIGGLDLGVEWEGEEQDWRQEGQWGVHSSYAGVTMVAWTREVATELGEENALETY